MRLLVDDDQLAVLRRENFKLRIAHDVASFDWERRAAQPDGATGETVHVAGRRNGARSGGNHLTRNRGAKKSKKRNGFDSKNRPSKVPLPAFFLDANRLVLRTSGRATASAGNS
ncbi:hypothetical protein ACR42A_11260 [Burkholderia gladioli]|uniref:hypothetical protein n=1 Tax=Burkholderia gladioli TaxID=28095 RepID=UPI003DA31208